ncbi:uncharacterized protein LOC112200945 [Rosa chinensis]|uniref:uncharacterized protein LOC112200945 n=1 Tax=Rosa chinensis TaxID=74649 RepID=UPI000D091401|nr:uncharacterized protein LOC112200945 [Rosa chinensis]
MGNWVGKERGVHPVDEDEGLHGVGSNSLMRIKLRMTKRELKELMAQVDMTNGGDKSEELGGLILKECLEGRLCARVVAVAADEDSDPKVSKYVKGWILSTSSEEEEHHHLL